MILLIHNNNQISKVLDTKTNTVLSSSFKNLNRVFFELAETYPNEKLVWCNKSLENYLRIENLEKYSNLAVKMCSFETSNKFYINSSIGLIDQSLFVNVNKKVEYPTWLMSSDIGVISCSSLIQFKQLLNYNLSFSELLNYIAKKGIQKGLLCYSNPNLLKSNHPKINKDTISNIQLFRFIKSNYKYRWVWLYQINQLVYHKKLFIFSLFSSFFYKKINISVKLPKIEFSKDRSKENLTIDVLIPTLGREKHLKQVLLDLSNQTLMPTRIIIIEQQAVENSSSTLDFLEENWPFEIDHTLIYQLGVCNARNLALNKVSSDWVFFADDDIRLNSDFLESSFKYIKKYKAKAVTLSCLQKNEIEKLDEVIQWSTFGTNATIVKSEYIKDIVFDMALEFGYGEDFDFGMLLRNSGVDVLYIPFVKMLHLKAPTGGFRKKIKKDWETEVIQPKPSPTVMVSKLKHATKEQLRSYKTNLFIKFYRNQAIKNPFRYFRVMRIAWNRSKFWANVLLKNNSDEI